MRADVPEFEPPRERAKLSNRLGRDENVTSSSGVAMATASADDAAVKGRPGLAAAALFGVSALAVLYLVFLYEVFNDASLRALGFTGLVEIRNISFLVLALLIIIMVVIWMRWVPVGAAPPASSGSQAGAPRGEGASQGKGQVKVADLDPASRPGAAASWRVPAVPPDLLQGGWKRYRFPAERTGGVCIDSDIVVDDGSLSALAGDTTPHGRTILRVRDEVARVCVRCDLMAHCHSKVAALITREEMAGNHECVPGLKRIATQKIEAMRAPPPAPAAYAVEPPPGLALEPSAPAPPTEGPESAAGPGEAQAADAPGDALTEPKSD